MQLPPIVTAAWLAQQTSQDPDAADRLIVVHVGTTMTGHDPYRSYEDSHLPGARYLSLDDDLAGPPAPVVGRHPLPTPEDFAAALGRVGVGLDDPVVVYDDRNGAFASRLVWMLRALGQHAALLDGGSDAWTGPMESGPGASSTVECPARPWPSDTMADADAVAAHIAAGGVVVDSREAARFAGEVEPIDAVAGHIPGAINLPFGANLVDGRWRSAADLRARFAPAAADPTAIVYCGSGVTACHNALAIEAAGLPRPRVYVGSWSGWSTDPARPVATGHTG